MKKETPKVLQLYSTFPLESNTAISMGIKLYPYTSQAGFLVETLEEYLKEGFNKLCRVQDDCLRVEIEPKDLRNMFFGFNPSMEVADKLLHMVEEDERAEQILRHFGNMDQFTRYAYLGRYGRGFSIATRKTNFKDMIRLIPPSAVMEGLAVSEVQYLSGFPKSCKFVGDPKGYKATPEIRRGKIREIRAILAEATKPFFIFYNPRSYYFARVGNTERLPPSDLDLIDCFPYKNHRHQVFFEGEEEYRTPEDSLIKRFERLRRNAKP